MTHWNEKIQLDQWDFNHLHIIYLQRKGFIGWKGYLSCAFGSMIRQIKKPNQSLLLPDGSAHFLEHRLFDLDGTDATKLFSKLGADANAFTSKRMMGFYFSTINHHFEALQILTDMALNVRKFDSNAVENEKNIIKSEIMMYEDEPFSRGYQQLLEQLYWIHPVRINIAGTPNSISLINNNLLETIHSTFFTPYHSKLLICGPENPFQFRIEFEKKLNYSQWNQSNETIDFVNYLEPLEVKNKFSEIIMPVTKDLFLIGFKTKKNSISLRDSLIGEIICHILFGSISPFYDLLYSQGLIDDSFYFSYDWDKDFGLIVLAGYTPHSSVLRKKIEKEIKNKIAVGIAKEEFEIIKHYFIGSTYTLIDKPGELMMHLTNLSWLNNSSWADYINEIRNLEAEDINKEMNNFLDLNYASVTLIHPSKSTS